jgi:uncharacterized protein (DUF2336 family)
MLKGLFTRKQANTTEATPTSYEDQRRQVQAREASVRGQLASRADTKPEILYYLADDADGSVRRAVAANHATPVQADVMLARDDDDDVRSELAEKIAKLAPEMGADERDKVRELTLEVLEILANDHLPRIRAILSEQLKHTENVPAHIIRRLAEDMETIVAAPVLRFSPLLSDDDLLEIIRSTRADGALAAVAERRNIGTGITDALIRTEDAEAVAVLLANDSAQIREETLDWLVERANNVEEWHNPLVHRKELSVDAIHKLARFVAGSLVKVLARRNDLDADTAAALAEQIRTQLDEDETADETGEAGAEGSETTDQRVKRMLADGMLDEEAVISAVNKGDKEFVTQALAVLANLPAEGVGRMISIRNASGVTAAVWKAGLSMRTAVKVQSRIARIPPPRMLNARNGTDFPLSESELQTQVRIMS